MLGIVKIVIIFLSLFLRFAQAEQTNFILANRGWWFYHDITNSYQTNQAQSCASPQLWQVACGFVRPTTYAFEQKQYKALLQQYAMNPTNLAAVAQLQKFNDWVITQAEIAAYSWQYNLVQEGQFDPTVSAPMAQFANQLILNLANAKKEKLFQLLAKTSLLVYFSRTDCEFCHAQAKIILAFADKTTIPVWNASLDKKIFPGYQRALTAPQTLLPAKLLKVDIVPALFLYLVPAEPNGRAQWIRLATGLTAQNVLEERTLNFLYAFRHALVQGYAQGHFDKDKVTI